MLLRFFMPFLVLLFYTSVARAVYQVDPRTVPISAEDMTRQIQTTDITSTKHRELILRARYSHLSKQAFAQYKKRLPLVKEKKEKSYAHLWLGVAANAHIEYSLNPFVRRSNPAELKTLLYAAKENLSLAANELPNSAVALCEYGYFLWQCDNQKKEGLSLLKKAVTLDPDDAFAHARLASVHSMLVGDTSSLSYADKEIEAAIRSDASFAYPHIIRVRMLINQKRYRDAQQALDRYLQIAHPSFASYPAVTYYQKLIKSGTVP